ncbi:hypothetical protein [uncultured Kordia sp.]|uniref:hypothetical protein n=1 Tax=uncultured Kordia sp. TaxID=507699 RepID=UPI0026236EA8|nr:hypothetical protein [uncultured Kordia sp.]
MIKKILLGIGSLVLALLIFGLLPISSFVKDETASDTIIVVGSILTALAIYKFLSSKLMK